jgi:hypothetical protein
MVKKMSRVERVLDIAERQRQRAAEDRRKRPYVYTKPTDDVLYIQNVAELLGCSIDHVRRIPRRELPAARVGPRLQFLREDVIALLRRRRDLGTGRKVDLGPVLRPTAPSLQDFAAGDSIVERTRAKLDRVKKK